MDPSHEDIPGVTDDPVLRLILEGRAKDLDEAEEIYLISRFPKSSSPSQSRSPITNLPSIRSEG